MVPERCLVVYPPSGAFCLPPLRHGCCDGGQAAIRRVASLQPGPALARRSQLAKLLRSGNMPREPVDVRNRGRPSVWLGIHEDRRGSVTCCRRRPVFSKRQQEAHCLSFSLCCRDRRRPQEPAQSIRPSQRQGQPRADRGSAALALDAGWDRGCRSACQSDRNCGVTTSRVVANLQQPIQHNRCRSGRPATAPCSTVCSSRRATASEGSASRL
jgi:hypothetical protein